MATETFTWVPNKEPAGTVTFRTKSAKFGDGYEETAEDGINNKTQSWPLTFSGPKARIKEIAGFLDRQRGATPFYWTEPLGDTALFKCAEYQPRHAGGDVYMLTPQIQPVAVQCQPIPKPAAWFMEERAPDLTQRMLNELSPSPPPAIKD